MYSPPSDFVPPMISAWTPVIGHIDEAYVSTSPVSAAWESVDRVVYVPVVLQATCVVRRVWWANGATTTGGATVAVGVYADSGYGPGTKIISGSAVQGTANEVQFVDVTDTAIPPGLHWLALMASSVTNTTLIRSSLATAIDASVRFEQASANPLPASATPVETTGSGAWLFGFATTASP
jgi:hypothetical protein